VEKEKDQDKRKVLPLAGARFGSGLERRGKRAGRSLTVAVRIVRRGDVE
jgi:hypothetical protein